MWEQSSSIRSNGKCKGPEVATSKMCSSDRKKKKHSDANMISGKTEKRDEI